MNDKQAALIKLAQVRCAINHVLRMRARQKQAGWWEDLNRGTEDFLSDMEMNPDRVNGVGNVGSPSYVRSLGGTRDAAGTMARYEHPENFPSMLVWPFNRGLQEAQDRVRRTASQMDPEKAKELEKWKEPHHNVDTGSSKPVPQKKTRMIPPPIRPQASQQTPSSPPSGYQPPLPTGAFQPGGLFPFR